MKEITLEQLINRLEMRESFIQQLDEQIVSGRPVILGPTLHQDDESQTEEESAAFERDNKNILDQMRKNQQDLMRLLK